ncbi:MAG: fused MFS/spermidine synthase [Candidatus Obscuribacterales bacterium]|nr:fused MFS/spermidine synthase [Candidatus Obscuribacterales bacterium]
MFWLVLALFFASGFSSLIYQVVWTRHLVLIFGSTTLATSTVLAVFMGGLALGSYFAGRIADKVARPFLWYGILEGIIGIWALAVPALLDISVSSYRVIWELTHFDFFSFSLLRLALAAIILLLPTTLMGATLPLLSKFVTDSLATVGDRVGTIYAINTLGAVCGAAQSGLILLPGMGLSNTTLIAAGVNFALCLIVLYVSARLERKDKMESQSPGSETAKTEASADAGIAELSKSKKKKKKKNRQPVLEAAPSQDSQAEEATAEPASPGTRVPARVFLALAAIAVSGAAAMVYEVCWTRTLSLIIGGSTYAFTVMLSTFLSGIFIGSIFCAKVVDRFKQPFLAFGVFQIFVAIGCILSLCLCKYLPMWNLQLNDIFPNALFSVWIRFILAESVLLPLTLFLGALFPVVIKCTTSDIEHIASSVGTVYSANTMGAILGSVVAGFVLIPQFGVEKTMLIATGVNLVLGTMMMFAQTDAKLSTKMTYVFLGAAVFIAFVANPNSASDKKQLLIAQSARRAMRDGYEVFKKDSPWRSSIDRTQIVYYKDGPCSNVAVLKFATGDKVGTFSLLTNGCVDASDGADMSQQVLLASYPMLFRPNARRACVIGWGSGVTIAELLNFPITSVTAVELEPAVIEAAKVFDKYTHSPEKNPRVKVEINDGRNFLLATTQKFDIIVSEPSNPWQVGVCNLFTEEYFKTVRDRLTPDGVLSLWLQLAEVSPDSVKSVLAALERNFGYCLALSSDSTNLVVLASQTPIRADYADLQDVFANPYIVRALDKAKITSPEAVLSRMVMTPGGVAYCVRGIKPNTDDLNLLEYRIGRTYESMTFAHANGVMLSENMGTPSGYTDWGNLSKEKIAAVMARVAIEATKFGNLTAAYSWARSSLETNQNDVAKRIIYWITQEDKKRTDFVRMRGEIEALDPNKSQVKKNSDPVKSDQRLQTEAIEKLKNVEKTDKPVKKTDAKD